MLLDLFVQALFQFLVTSSGQIRQDSAYLPKLKILLSDKFLTKDIAKYLIVSFHNFIMTGQWKPMGTYDQLQGLHHAFTNWSSSGDLEVTSLHPFRSKQTPWGSSELLVMLVDCSRLVIWAFQNCSDGTHKNSRTAGWTVLDYDRKLHFRNLDQSEMTLKSFACLQLLNPLRTPSHIQLCLATGLAGKTGTVATLSSFCFIQKTILKK